MKRIKIGSFALLLTMLFTSCAKNITCVYQMETANTSTIVLTPQKPTERTYVTINDNMLVKKKSIKSVTIKNVPKGEYVLKFACDNSSYRDKADTTLTIKISESNKTIDKIVAVPPYNTGYYIYNGIIYMSCFVPLLLIL